MRHRLDGISTPLGLYVGRFPSRENGKSRDHLSTSLAVIESEASVVGEQRIQNRYAISGLIDKTDGEAPNVANISLMARVSSSA